MDFNLPNKSKYLYYLVYTILRTINAHTNIILIDKASLEILLNVLKIFLHKSAEIYKNKELKSMHNLWYLGYLGKNNLKHCILNIKENIKFHK